MMGRLASGQERLFYSFNLEEHVPQSHLLRGIDRSIDLSGLHDHLAEHYSHTGRPSIDPELMLRMLIVGYCYGIRSERRLCEELHLNLAYRWFCRLGLEDAVPDHSTFSKNRHGRFRDSQTFRWLFDEVVRRCMAQGLVKGEGFAVDASVVAADANRQRGVPGTESVDWKDPALSTRAVREYLQALDGEPLAQVMPKNISLTDPQARWTAAPGGPAFYAYSTNYLVDVEHGVIVDVEATPANRAVEVESTKTMIDRVADRFDLAPERLIGDPLTVPRRCWPGWSRTRTSSPTYPFGRGTSAMTALSPEMSFSGMRRPTSTAVLKGTPCAASGGNSSTRAPISPRPRRSSTAPVRRTVRRAR